MKMKIKNIFIIFVSLIILIYIVLHSGLVIANIVNTANIWIKRIYPSLFPMFILSDILINYNFPYYISCIFNYIFKVKKFNIFIFIISMFSGCPSNAKMLKELLELNIITKKDTECILTYTMFPSIIFLSYMSKLIFNTGPLKYYAILVIDNIVIYYLYRKRCSNKNMMIKSKPFFKLLGDTINNNTMTILSILGVMIVYSVLCLIISDIFNLNTIFKSLIFGVLELSNSINSLINLNIFLNIKEYLFIIYFSFGGLSIYTQIKSILNDTSISLKNYLKSRIIASILGIILLTIINYIH